MRKTFHLTWLFSATTFLHSFIFNGFPRRSFLYRGLACFAYLDANSLLLLCLFLLQLLLLFVFLAVRSGIVVAAIIIFLHLTYCLLLLLLLLHLLSFASHILALIRTAIHLHAITRFVFVIVAAGFFVENFHFHLFSIPFTRSFAFRIKLT